MPNIQLENGINPATATAEEVQAYIDIATSLLVDLLNARGLSLEQWREFRKNIVAEEKQFIQSEIERFSE